MSIIVGSVFNALQGFYVSIDLRILAFKEKNQWINFVSSLFFSEKPVEHIKKMQKSIKCPELEDLRLFTYALRSSELGSLSRQISKNGMIRAPISKFSEESISLGNFDPRHITVSNQTLFPQLINNWKIIGGLSTEKHPNRDNCWELLEKNNALFIPLGYENIYQWITHALGISRYEKGGGKSFLIGLPIKAKFNELKVNENIVKFNVKSHKKIPNLQVNFFLWDYDAHIGEWKTIDRKQKLLTRFNKKTNDYILYTDEVKFSSIHPRYLIRAHLISTNIPQILIDETRCVPPLENTLEPLVKAMGKFYPLKQFRNQLLNPEKIEKKRREHDSGWFFEEAISWLLSLGGLSVIRLGEKETFQLESGVTLSADIIAYKENDYLFVIDCDIQHADPNKADQLLQIVEVFKQIQNEIGKPEIIPILFTPKEPTTSQIQDKVRVINGPLIEDLIQNAVEGDIEGFYNILKT